MKTRHVAALFLLASCSSSSKDPTGANGAGSAASLPAHQIHSETGLSLKTGKRVEIRAEGGLGLSDADCDALLKHYRPRGAPDGQVSVRVDIGSGNWTPLCVENFDGRPVNMRATAEALQKLQ